MFTLRRTRSALFVFYQYFKEFGGQQSQKVMNMTSKRISNDDFVYIAFPQAPIYLREDTLREKSETESRISGGLGKYCNSSRAIYLAFPKGDSPAGFLDSYIWSAVQSQKLFRQSSLLKDFGVAHCLNFSKNGVNGSQENESRNSFCRGVCVYPENEGEIMDTHDIIAVLQEQDFDIFSVSLSTPDHKRLIWKSISSSKENSEELQVTCIDANDVASQLKESCVSPLFTLPSISPVHHSFEEAKNILKKCLDLPEVAELLDITDKHVPCTRPTEDLDRICQHPFVVVEGMDATGKTTLTQILEEKLGAARYYTPPPQIQHLRPFFDALPEIVRRAYYCMGNYIVAEDIIRECKTRPVIMDRFWHSTTAYGIANETSSGDLPGAGHSVYHWPRDLLKPRLVLFLTVSEEVRKQRHTGRGGTTFEERSLNRDQLFRQRLCDSYRRMESPGCFEIDASGTVEEVSQLAQEALLQHGIQLDKKIEG